ncbi:aminoglycoside phosphotransferase family protein [Pseudoalteromonas xiamenensis]|uniref:Aminoglycoside phosphotransferase family protein n=1 Tax=Pseudoalteromonas xiamenensis TaxID=882626 RepID=A0A975DGB6_9GAMM|nr:aminoglycoside phosphotransferase family protein [Pseudoalteromonas xiamenensis]QTH71044.1 aminoglycoside phosphotransferase family protein [Pseudoalteromonas xiamenensis]
MNKVTASPHGLNLMSDMLNRSELDWIATKLGKRFIINEIVGGANNQGFLIEADSKSFFLKRFAKAESSKVKLEREVKFATVLNQLGIKQIASPIAFCSELLISLFEYLDGSKITHVVDTDVVCAVDFIANINCPQPSPYPLPYASESPENYIDFYNIIKNRIARLLEVKVPQQFQNAFSSLLNSIEDTANETVNNINIDWNISLDRGYLSPSDFGFHNAIKKNHEIFFFDFEYAGYDSLWKLFCDFFAQPAIPVPISYSNLFLENPLFIRLKEQPEPLASYLHSDSTEVVPHHAQRVSP